MGKLTLFFLIPTLISCDTSGKGAGDKTGNERKLKMSQGPHQISEDEFWTNPLKNWDKPIDGKAFKGKKILAIDAPLTVDLDLRKTIPVPVCYFTPQSDRRAFAFQDAAVIVARRLEDRQVFFGKAADPIATPRGKNTPPANPDSWLGSSHLVDLKRHPGLPWKPASYRVTLLLRELASNSVTVTLGDSAGKYKDPEVEKFLAAQRAPTPSVYPAPGDPLPHFRLWASSPAVPDSEGIALHIDPHAKVKPGATIPLSASFRLKPLRHEIVEGAKPDSAQAIIPITIIVTGTENGFPIAYEVRVPCYGKQGAENLTGHFAFDLLKIPQLEARPQTYYVYVFSGAALAGPATVRLE